jgi:hypothetical protein
MASISNNTNIPLGVGATFEGLYEQLSAGVESIQINVKSDEAGILRVFFAITPTVLLYEKSYTYLANEYFFISVPKIATYFRCDYTNGATAQTVFQLRTTFNNYLLVDEPTSGTGAIVQVSNFPSVQTVDGSVSVSGFTGTLDVNVLNYPASQTVDGTVSVSGVVDTSGSSVSISNFPSVQTVDGTVSVSNLPTTQTASIVHLDFDTNMTIVSDSTLPWIQPINGEQGWQYINTSIGGSQIYYYTNSGMLIPGTQESPITLGSVLSQYFVGNMKVLADSDALPIVAIYTQPQGSGDFNPAYRSRKTYRPTTGVLSKGANYYFHWGEDANILTEYERQTLTLSNSVGPCDSAEIVLFMSINTDSLAPVDTVNLTLKHAGFTTATDTRQVNFDNSKQKNLYSQVENLTFIDDAVSVIVSNFPASQTIDGTISISGVVDVSGSSVSVSGTVGLAEGAQVNLVNSTVGLIENTVVGLAEGASVSVSNFPASQTIDGTISVSGVVDVSGSSVSVSNFPASQTVSGTISANCYGSSDGTIFHHLKTTVGGELVTHSQTRDGSGASITSTTSGTIRALDVCVSNFPPTQAVSISGTVPVENATGSALIISKGSAVPFSVYTGALASVGTFGSVDLNGYSSFDLQITQLAGSVSFAGSLYVVVSNDGVNWFVNLSNSVLISVSTSNKSYLLAYPSLNSRYVGITTENPFGGAGLTTTNSVITLSAKR